VRDPPQITNPDISGDFPQIEDNSVACDGRLEASPSEAVERAQEVESSWQDLTRRFIRFVLARRNPDSRV
jgi:hypothetical protein